MKRFLFIGILSLGMAATAQAQRYCVIDSKFILEKMVEYKDAQTRLDQMAERWQEDIDKRIGEVDALYKSYQAERPMLSDEMRKKREDEIMAKEKEVKDLQKQRFGFEGDLFVERQKLIKPIQDKVFNAVQSLATKKSYDLVLDKASGVSIFYANPKLDLSTEVLKILGINN